MGFTKESDFELALIALLKQKGWEEKVIEYPTENDLLKNWADILFENNRETDRLNNVPLTDSEMQQILEQIAELKTPLKLNGFINGKNISIRRDNELDSLHFGKEISLKIYDRLEIAGGQSKYQIVRQPQFPTKSPILKDRRGDIMLLINGMPVFHIELKRSGVPISQACYQIEKYAHEGIFSGLFALVQIFVAMTPEKTLYFANPNGQFNPNYYFHWADFNNEPVNDYKDIASQFLSIPMAHQLIGFYMVPDDTDGVLKVMRSYQYYAAHAISDRVSKLKWQNYQEQRGGYIWHTTGSGKTMTSFKSAQLISSSQDADKVIFLMDRIELGTQSLEEYRNFADENQQVQETKSTYELIKKLKSNNSSDTLIVTSIQKMSNLAKEQVMKESDLAKITAKRIVIIVDECHRSTFGDMLQDIKRTFAGAVFFGFTGTPIFEDNQKKNSATTDVFGDELHRYSIADGIRDKNVLGFDIYKVSTYKENDLRQKVALVKTNAHSESEVWENEDKKQTYLHFMDSKAVSMAEIEDLTPPTQWQTEGHYQAVVEDVLEHFPTLSRGKKFHAIFATSSISEAIDYYRLFKQSDPTLKITALFDPNEDNQANSFSKEQGLAEIIGDYNQRFAKTFTIASHAQFKKDVAERLAHKETYKFINNKPEEQLDLLIVVDQMLTGYDSKWVNTLYLDKLIRYELLIQAFSRTNRLFGKDKQFGTIRYYRKPATMEQNIEKAVELYSGNRPIGLFVEKIPQNINKMNGLFEEISQIFQSEEIQHFAEVPKTEIHCVKFISLFNQMNNVLEAAKIQGFDWDKTSYGEGQEKTQLLFTKQIYDALLLRYKELAKKQPNETERNTPPPFDIDSYITAINTDKIDHDYLNSRFDKYLKALCNDENTEIALNELHQAFPTLSADEQRIANILLHDIQRGDLQIEQGKTFKDYIIEHQTAEQHNRLLRFAEDHGLDANLLIAISQLQITEENINRYLEELKTTANKAQAKKHFEKEGELVLPYRVHMKLDQALREFLLPKQ